MSCDRYHDEIAESAAGAPARELAAHIEECEACREELEVRRRALATVDEELRTLLASAPSPDLSARIHRAVAVDREAGWGNRARPTLAMAAALLIALGGVALWWTTARPSVPDTAQQGQLAPEPSVRDLRARPLAGVQAPTAKQQRERNAEAEVAVGKRKVSEPPPVSSESQGPPSLAVGSHEPEVLVPPGQEGALLRFAADLHSRTVTPDSLLVADPAAPLNAPRPLHRVEIEMLTLGSPVASGL